MQIVSSDYVIDLWPTEHTIHTQPPSPLLKVRLFLICVRAAAIIISLAACVCVPIGGGRKQCN